MKLSLVLTLMLLCPAVALRAQTGPQIAFDAPSGVTPAQGNLWTSVLYVNGTPFPMVHTCVAAGPLTTCTAPLPNISSALTATGPQTFTVSFKDVVLGEGPQSGPLVRLRPSAPSIPRIN